MDLATILLIIAIVIVSILIVREWSTKGTEESFGKAKAKANLGVLAQGATGKKTSGGGINNSKYKGGKTASGMGATVTLAKNTKFRRK